MKEFMTFIAFVLIGTTGALGGYVYGVNERATNPSVPALDVMCAKKGPETPK